MPSSQLGWTVQDGVPHGEQLVLAAIGSTTALPTSAPWFSAMWLEHLTTWQSGMKQELPALLRPGFRRSRISFLRLKQ